MSAHDIWEYRRVLLLFHLVQAPVAHTGLVSDRRRRRDLEIWLRHLTPAPVAGLGLQFVTVRVRPGPPAGPARPRLAPSVASHHDSGASLARPSSSSGPTVNKLDPSRSARLDRRVSSQNHAASEAELSGDRAGDRGPSLRPWVMISWAGDKTFLAANVKSLSLADG